MSAHASRFARDRAQHSEAAGIDQRYSSNLVERLYEIGWRASQVQVLMAKNSEKSISLCSLVGLWSLLLGLIRTFHTVSLGTSVNKSRFGHADSSPIHRHPLPCGQ